MYPLANFGLSRLHHIRNILHHCCPVAQEIRKENGTGVAKYDAGCLAHPPSSHTCRLASFIPSDHGRTSMKEEGLRNEHKMKAEEHQWLQQLTVSHFSATIEESSEIIPTRCNNCVYSLQWLYSTCFGWQFHPSSGVQCCIWPFR